MKVARKICVSTYSELLLISFLSSHTGTAPTRGSPGLQNQTGSTGRPGIHGDRTTGVPGLYTTRSQGGLPGVASLGVTGQPGLQKTTTPSMISSVDLFLFIAGF